MADPTPFDDGALYDEWAGELDFGRDFYVNLAREAAGPVLDIACGTGRILLPCLEAGIDIEGLDFYAPMLDQLRRKASQKGLSPRLHQADMSDFQLDRRFALIMIPFNAFIHNLTTETQLRSLTLCKEHLLPDGNLVFDTFFPAPEFVNTPPGTRVLEGEKVDPSSGSTTRFYDTRTVDRVRQIFESKMEVEYLDLEQKIVKVVRSQTTTSWFYKREMELLLRLSGFPQWDIYGDFDRRPLERETDLMIVSASR